MSFPWLDISGRHRGMNMLGAGEPPHPHPLPRARGRGNFQSSAQPTAISHQPSAISAQPWAAGTQYSSALGGSPQHSALTPLPRTFYLRPTVEVARDLLGRYLVLGRAGEPFLVGRIVEAEAYLGEEDRACHAFHGRTRRTAPMYEEAGHAYVYFVYGMYWCLNVVTEEIGRPCAVLLRAVEPVAGLDRAADGPGKLCRAFGLDGLWNRADLTNGELRVTSGDPAPAGDVAASPRVGVAYAGEWADRPLRYYVASSSHVSKPGGRARPARAP